MVMYTNKLTGEQKELDKNEFMELIARLQQEAQENKQLKRDYAKRQYQKAKAKEKAENTYLGKALKRS